MLKYQTRGNTGYSGRSAFTPQTPSAGRAYSGRVTYVDGVRNTFITQYVYESGRLGYPVEHSMEHQRGVDLKVGDDVEIAYPREGGECGVTVLSTAEERARQEREEQERNSPERAAQEAQLDKELIEKYANPKTPAEAKDKNRAILRESSRNKRFENVKVIEADETRHTVTTSNGQGDKFTHDAGEWIGLGEIKAGDTLSIDYMRQPRPGAGMPYVENKTAEERAQKLGYGDPDFARGGPFDHVKITALNNEKNTLTTQDAEGKKHVHRTGKWGAEKAMYQAGDVISIRLPEQGSKEPARVFNHSYFGRIIGKYKLLEHPLKYPAPVLRNFPSNPSSFRGADAGRAASAIEDVKRLFAYDLSDGLNPYKSLTVTEIDKDKNTITAVNDKGESSVHSIEAFRYKNDLVKGDKVTVRYNDLEHPEKGLRIFDETAYERHKAENRFKEVKVIDVDRFRDVFTTQSKTGEKFTHDMYSYKWKNKLQPGHLVTVQYEDNDVTKAMSVFNHTTYQESLIRSLTRRTQQEALEKKPQKAIMSRIGLLNASPGASNSSVKLKENISGRNYYVSMDDLTKALNCKASDLETGDTVELTVKNPANEDGSLDIVSAKSKDVEERICSQEQGLGR